GGMAAWQEASLTTQSLAEMPVEVLHKQSSSLSILDVRDQSEWEEGHIKGALHLPYYFIEQSLQSENSPLPALMEGPTAVLCASGQRSTIACSLLQRHGFKRLFNIV